MATAKVVVIGLDGLDPSMTGYLPSLSAMRLYRLDSIIPLTYPSWTTIETGVNPGKHGILDFFDVKVRDGRLDGRLMTIYDMDYPRFFESIRLSPARRRVRFAVVNPIPSYPLTPVPPSDGVVISIDFFTPKPAATDARLASRYYDLKAYWEEVKHRYHVEASCKGLYKAHVESIRRHREALESMLEDFDVVWLSIQLPDVFLHKCPKETRGGALLKSLLSEADSLVRTALDSTPNVIVVSDHGFTVYEGAVRVNALLYREGYIVKSSRISGDGDDVARSFPGARKIVIGARWYRLGLRVARGPLRPVARAALRLADRMARRLIGAGVVLATGGGIDYERSKAFVPAWSSIDPVKCNVIVNDPAIRGRLVKLFREVGLSSYLPEDLLDGPKTPRNLVFVYGGRRYPIAGAPDDDPFIDKEAAQHARYGVLALRLEDAEEYPSGEVLPGYAVAPILLCLAGVPIDKYMDGYTVAARVCGRHETLSYRGRWLALRNLLARRA